MFVSFLLTHNNITNMLLCYIQWHYCKLGSRAFGKVYIDIKYVMVAMIFVLCLFIDASFVYIDILPYSGMRPYFIST